MWDGSNTGQSKKSLVCAVSAALQFSVEQSASFLFGDGIYDMCVLKYYGFPPVKSVLRVLIWYSTSEGVWYNIRNLVQRLIF